MRRPVLLAIFIVSFSSVLGLFSVFAYSQSMPLASVLPSTESGSNSYALTISKRVDEVNLAFTVTDKKGHLINDLDADDFTILDNHIAPDGVNYFQQQTDLPLRIGILIDASDSILYRFNYEKTAAVMFLKRILREGKDQAFLVTFNDRVNLIQDETDDTKQLTRAVKHAKAGGNTALYDAIVFSANKLRNSPPQTRRAIIVITDGEDTKSRQQILAAEQAATRAEVTVFALSTNEFPLNQYSGGEGILNRLTVPSGGTILPARDEYHLSRAFRSVEMTLRNQYAVAYRPARFAPDGSFRPVEIFPTRKGLKVQCRQGYYARQEPAMALTH